MYRLGQPMMLTIDESMKSRRQALNIPLDLSSSRARRNSLTGRNTASRRCRRFGVLQGVDVDTYLVDLPQRVSEHRASEVIDLSPRVWKTKFAHCPIRSDLALAEQ